MSSACDYFKLNDYELLYLIQCQNELAMELMIEKYNPLIKKRIHKYCIKDYKRDDFYQEGNMILMKAIKTFNTLSPMSFTNYFDLLLTRHLLNLLRKDLKDNKLEYRFDFDDVATKKEEEYLFFYENELSEFGFSFLEKKCYIELFINNNTVENAAKNLAITSKSVSNTRQRIIQKMRRRIEISNIW